MREKWERDDYRTSTIAKAIDGIFKTSRSKNRTIPPKTIWPKLADNEPYCPYQRFHSVQIPLAIARDRHLSAIARFVFGRKIFFANRASSTFVGADRLASDLGVSTHAILSAEREILKAGYFRVRAGTATEMQFIWRETLRSCLLRRDEHLTDGEAYRPHRMFDCIHIPMAIAACPGLGWTAKEIFGILQRASGPGRYWIDIAVSTLEHGNSACQSEQQNGDCTN